MKLSQDQKRLAKNAMFFLTSYFAVYILVNWIKDGAFSWDSVWEGLLIVLGIGVLDLLLVIGSYVPKKKKDTDS